MSLSVTGVGRSDTGKVRDTNEDSFYAGARVFCVADGLGGHQAGEIASQLAVKAVSDLDQRLLEDAVSHLGEAVRKANRLVHDEARSDPAKAGMATTVTAVVVDSAAAHLAHVGDSRCYLLRDDEVSLLTEDHTVVGRMVADGLLTREQAAQHPQRSMVTRAVGTGRQVDVDLVHVPLHGGDRLLLCSDGLTAVVEPTELTALAATGDLDEAADQMIALALERGAPDNVTVVLVEVSGTPSGGSRTASGTPRTRTRRRDRRPAVKRVFGIPRRMLVWSLLVIVVLAAATMTVRTLVAGTYFVGLTEDDRVAIYNGVPVEVPFFTKQDLVTRYENLHADDLREGLRRELEQGVIKDTLTEAQAYVEGVLRPSVRLSQGRPPGGDA